MAPGSTDVQVAEGIEVIVAMVDVSKYRAIEQSRGMSLTFVRCHRLVALILAWRKAVTTDLLPVTTGTANVLVEASLEVFLMSWAAKEGTGFDGLVGETARLTKDKASAWVGDGWRVLGSGRYRNTSRCGC